MEGGSFSKTLTTLTAKPGKPAWKNGLLNNTRIVCADSDSAKALDQTSGSSSWGNVFVSGGHGPFAGGSQFSWTGGGIEKGASVRKYGAGYYADLLRGLRLKSLVLQGLRFPAGCVRYETILRIMGVDDVYVNDCVFDGSKQVNNKEAMQCRSAIKARFIGCHFYGSVVLGALKLGQADDKSLDAYHKDAEQNRIDATFEDCTFIGHLRCTGQSDVVLKHPKFLRPDPRGNSPKEAIQLETFKTIHGKTLVPTCTVIGGEFAGWKLRAVKGVQFK